MEAETRVSAPSVSLRASISRRMRRRVSAWALPRPSATASAKLAKSTVIQSQSVTWPVNHRGSMFTGRRIKSRSQRMEVSTLPTSTTNMTGFFIMSRGESLRKLSNRAGPRMALLNRDISWRVCLVMMFS